MPRSLRCLRRTTVALATGLLVAAPAAHGSGSVDLRSPDTRDAATTRQAVDLRSPDARDLSFAAAPDQPSPSGTDWADVGIGAGTAVVLLVGLGGAVVAQRRRDVVVPS
jgi:hypothetical protein